MSNYTGPVTRIFFMGQSEDDQFAIDFFTDAQDEDAAKKIKDRYAEDGYKPIRTMKLYMRNGTLERRDTRERVGPVGFSTHSAFLRA